MNSNVSCQVPVPWLDHEFLENMLKKSESDESIRVKSVSGKAATANGDNYMSDIIRISVKFTRDLSGRELTEHKSVIFKVELNKETFVGDLSVICGVFDTEIKMMTNTLIEMTEALNEKDVRFCARVYCAKIGDPSFLALEDLGSLGFRMADRQIGLDLQHCRLVMQRLAKFHASSVAVREKNPNVSDRYSKSIYEKGNSEQMKALIKGGVVSLAIESAKWTDLDPSYSEKLYKISEVCYEKAVEFTRAQEDDFNVIIHGDCWVNNLLFRYNDEGKVVDQIFVDFQLSVWTSPAIDLLYFLAASANDDVTDHHYDELINEYLNTLAGTMSRMGCKTEPPTLESLRKSLQKRQFLTVLFSTMCLPFVLADETEVLVVSDLMDPANSGQVTPGYRGERYRKKITRRLREWNSRGLLDV